MYGYFSWLGKSIRNRQPQETFNKTRKIWNTKCTIESHYNLENRKQRVFQQLEIFIHWSASESHCSGTITILNLFKKDCEKEDVGKNMETTLKFHNTNNSKSERTLE